MPILETIAIYLGIKTLDKITNKSLDFAFSKIQQPEYEKYKKCFNPPFVMAFKRTISVYSDKENSPWGLQYTITQDLSNLNDLEINLIFGNAELEINYFINNDPFDYIKDSFKAYLKTRYQIDLDNNFFEIWKDIFQQKYKESFEEFCSNDNVFFQQTAINLLELSIENLQQIKTLMLSIDKKCINIQENTEEIKEYSKTIKSEICSLNTKIAFITENLTAESDKNNDFQGELEKLQKLIEENKYQECISYIDLNINDNWFECNTAFKAEVFNKKGVCYLNLNNFIESSSAFNAAINLKPDFDKAISNICLLFLQNGNHTEIKQYITKFADESSPFYQQIKFFDLFFINNDVEQAEEFLEQHKSTIKDYQHLKAKLLFQKKASYEEIIELLEQYLSNNPDFIASYELAVTKFLKLFNDKKMSFSFAITSENDAKIAAVTNEKLNTEELNELIDYLTDLIKNPKANVENLKELNLSIKIMISILHSQKADIAIAENYINEISSNQNVIKNDFVCNNLFMLYLLLEKFNEAKTVFENGLEGNLNLGPYIIALFALQEYEKVLNNLEKITEVEASSLELIKIIALEKTKKWIEVFNYLKTKINSYSDETKFFISDLCFGHFEYDFCQSIYVEITKNILSEKVFFEPQQIYMLANKLNHFKEKELEEKLIFFYWNKYPEEENFKIGLLCATNLFNNKKHPECLTILKKLSKINPSDDKIQELYANIDLINFNPDNLIKNYEEGNTQNYLLPYVANAYLQKKEFCKAESIAENLKYIKDQEINHYLIKAHICFLRETYDDGISILTEAYNKFPESTEVRQNIVCFVLHRKSKTKLDDNFAKIFNESMQFLVEKKIIFSFSVNSENVIEDIKKGIESIEPLTDLIEREKMFIESLEKYNNFEYPLEILFNLVNADSIDFFTEILLNKNYSINISRGNVEKISHEVSLLRKQKDILINIYTLILLKTLEIEEVVQENFNLKISCYTKTKIEKFLNDFSLDSSGVLVRQKDGTPMLITDEKPVKKYIDFLKNILKNYDVEVFDSASNKALELITAENNLGIKGFFHDGIVALQRGHLVCIDGIFSEIYNEFQVQTVSTISILDYLYSERLINQEKYSDLKVRLCKLNCKLVSISSNDLHMVLNSSLEDFNILLNSLNHKIFNIDSVSRVFSDFILKLNNSNNISDLKIDLSLKTIFEKAIILYPSGVLVRKILVNIYNFYSLLENNLQTSLGYCIYNSLNSIDYNEIMGFYFALIKKIYKAEDIFLIKISNDLVTKVISNAPQEIRSELFSYAANKFNYNSLIYF